MKAELLQRYHLEIERKPWLCDDHITLVLYDQKTDLKSNRLALRLHPNDDISLDDLYKSMMSELQDLQDKELEEKKRRYEEGLKHKNAEELRSQFMKMMY
jgi:hypothetical protein